MAEARKDLLNLIDNSIEISEGKTAVTDPAGLRASIERLVEASAAGSRTEQGWARFLVRSAALALGIIPASIHALYSARGRGDVPLTFTVPAVNLRVLSYDAARSVFRALKKIDGGAVIFEIARSEIGYTAQRPAEYATNVLAAAIAENWVGPVFIQGDHFQVSGKKYGSEPQAELDAVRSLTAEAIAAGFFNIDIDTSTMVDLEKPTIPEQQALNSSLSAVLTSYVRSLEPEGVTISVGGEIGEVGGHNSTEPELRAYMDGFDRELKKLAPGAVGLSKISIQTGTSHGGVVLPDGSIAEVKLDFNTLRDLSRIARADYGMAGTVQHGASTLPQDAFGKFVEYEAAEVHLATGFMNTFYDRISDDLRNEMYAWLDENHAADRKKDLTEEQFYYKTRKNAVGPFKKHTWELGSGFRQELGEIWESQFGDLFESLGAAGTMAYVNEFIQPVAVQPQLVDYLGEQAAAEDVKDLAD